MASATTSPDNLSKVFKAYDVRGIVGEQLDEDLARATGAAYVEVLGVDAIVVGYDMRPELARRSQAPSPTARPAPGPTSR